MKKMNKKGFTLVELLAVIVILAILMAIAATNIGPVIDNSRRSSMRTTAQMIIEGVQTQLQTGYAFEPGTYTWDKNILDRGGINAPFGGEYVYYDSTTVSDKPAVGSRIGSGVYQYTTPLNDTELEGRCAAKKISFVHIQRDSATGNYKYTICLSTSEDSYLFGTREQVDNTKDNTIFGGTAKVGTN